MSVDSLPSLIPVEHHGRCSTLLDAHRASVALLEKLSHSLVTRLHDEPGRIAAVIAGSLGRKEAVSTSDLDVFLLFSSDVPGDHNQISERILADLKNQVSDAEFKGLRVASPGTFNAYCHDEELLHNIGGRNENNDNLTRRMLLLLESQSVCCSGFLEDTKHRILERYLKDIQPSGDPRPIFLLNDFVRYHRTITIDYEYKRTEAGKPWAIRLTKLRHSRKMLYFSGVLPLCVSMDKLPEERLDWIINEFLTYTPIERISRLLREYGGKGDWALLETYSKFMKMLSDQSYRDRLDKVPFDGRDNDPDYIRMRDNAQEFRLQLMGFAARVPNWTLVLNKYIAS